MGLRADQIATLCSLLKTELALLEKRSCSIAIRGRGKVRGKVTNLKI